MKKKIVNGFLMMALLVSAMGTFVSCKDYDEDAYVDLRNRISNEVSLREGLQKQVDLLIADINTIKSTYATIAWVNENFYTKEQVDAKFVTIEEFAKCKADCAAFKKLLNERIDSLNNVVNGIKAQMATKDDIKGVIELINAANEAISAVKTTAEEAKEIAEKNKAALEELTKRVAANETNISNLTNIVNDLKIKVDGYDTVIQTLSEKVDDLNKLILAQDEKIKAMYDSIAKIEVRLDAYEIRISTLESSYEELHNLYEGQQEQINNLFEKIENINFDWVLQIQQIINQLTETSNEAKEIAEEAMMKAGDAYALAQAAYAKASNAEQLALKALYAAQDAVNRVEALEKKYDQLLLQYQKLIADAQKWLEECKKQAEKAKEQADLALTYKNDAEAAKKDAEGFKNDAEAAKQRCEEIYALIKDYKPSEIPADLENRLKKAEQDAKDAKDKAEAAEQKAKDAEQKAKDAEKKAEQAETIAKGIEEIAKQAKEAAEKAKEDAEKAAKEAKEAKDKADQLAVDLSDLEKKVNANTLNIQGLDEKLKQETKNLNDKIAGINSTVSGISTTVDQLGDDLKDLTSSFKSMITGILLQATSNPVVGYLNMPGDVRSLILMTYFGKADAKFAFPAKGGKWVDPDEAFTDDDIDIMTGGAGLGSIAGTITQAGDEYFAKDNGDGKVNLGTVYMTINPTNVDMTGQTLTLENSKGQQSKVELTPLKKSNFLLTFGYDRTRAASNGFYEATAQMEISQANLDAIRLSVAVDDLIESAKKAFKNKSKSDLISVAADLYQSIDNEIDASAVKATWTDDVVGERSVYSEYGIGVTAVKPMSFNSLNIDALKKGLPGKSWFYKLIDKIISQIKIDVPNIDLNKTITFNKVEADGNILKVTFDANINGSVQTMTIQLTADKISSEDIKTIEDLGDLLVSTSNGSVASVEIGKLLTELNDLDTEWEAAIDKAKQDMIDGIQKYVDKAYNKLNSYFQLYTLFDINLVVHQNGKGFKYCGVIPERATKVEGETALYPTSNTFEYFAPAYKKFVAISNVYDAATMSALSKTDAIAKAKAAKGENMGEVIDGDTRVTIKGQAGYIYEIAYSAVDYHGIKTCKKFYVKF